jgi:hypothetical protein
MALIYKVLGQSNPTANTLTTLYTAPVASNTVVSTIAICNLDANASTFRVAVRPSGEAIANKHYLNYDTPLPGKDTITATIGITLAANDVISINASSSLIAFSLFGSEIT